MDQNNILSTWDQHKTAVISLIRNRVKRISDVEDILQEVFIKYWLNNHKINDKTKFSHWLTRVTLFTICDYYRKKTKEKITDNLMNSENSTYSINENNSSDDSKKLIPIIYSLPAKYRNIL